jgi:hypothetical protein
MVRPLELELRTYDRERARLEAEHCGKFVLIRGEEVAGIFDDFQTASQHAAQRFKRESYLVHCIATEMMHIPSALLDGLATMYTHARGGPHQQSVSPLKGSPTSPVIEQATRAVAEAPRTFRRICGTTGYARRLGTQNLVR